MNSSNANNTLIDEMMQLLIAEKEKAFPTILAKLYNQAMIVERETHLGAGLERGEDAGRGARQMAQTQARMHQGPLRRRDLSEGACRRRRHGSGDLHRYGYQRRRASEHHSSRLRVRRG